MPDMLAIKLTIDAHKITCSKLCKLVGVDMALRADRLTENLKDHNLSVACLRGILCLQFYHFVTTGLWLK